MTHKDTTPDDLNLSDSRPLNTTPERRLDAETQFEVEVRFIMALFGESNLKIMRITADEDKLPAINEALRRYESANL